jgi:hypothetical protein
MEVGMNVRAFVFSAALATAVATMTLHASVPVGVYAVVDKVVVEPNDTQPERVKIWGVFSVWDERSGAGYAAPERGFLYYSCAKREIELCRAEWADLKSVAGRNETVGFGSRSLAAGRVHGSDDRAAAPAVYPIQFGIVRVGAPRGRVFDQLRAAAQRR